jgi:hypothetical protein
MEPISIRVGGTSKVFSRGLPIGEILPEFSMNFSNEMFNLTSYGSSDFLVSYNHEPKIYSEFIKSGGSRKNAVLIRMEPEAVYPAQFKKRVTDKYDLVITTGSPTINEGKFFSVKWPYKYHFNPASPSENDPDLYSILATLQIAQEQNLHGWNNRKFKVTLIAGNKVSPSLHSNYKVRRTLARQLEISELKIFGPLWNDAIKVKLRHRLAVLYAATRSGTLSSPSSIYGNLLRRYSNAVGEVVDKHQIMKDSKFSLVIENSNFVITEKIFDAIINGSVPIYIGPELSNFGIPKEVAIEYNYKLSSFDEITSNMTDQQAIQILASGRNFLLGPNFKNMWSADAVFGEISSLIKDYISKVF